MNYPMSDFCNIFCNWESSRGPRVVETWFKAAADAAVKGRIYSIYSMPELSEEFLWWSWNEGCITNRWDTASWCGRSSWKEHFSLFYFRLVITSAYTNLYFIITNIHTELKPQVKASHGMNFQCLDYTQCLINHGQLVNHTVLIKFD